jgi:FkbM family methyltransferase
MNFIEKACVAIRHSPLLNNAGWLWNTARPVYDATVNALGRGGLERVINGTDRVLVAPQFRGLGESYEPEVWRHVMANVRPGDMVADVGAYIGLYAIALGRRVGHRGQVTAFEPDATNFRHCQRHVELNGVSTQITAVNVAVGAADGRIAFTGDHDIHNQIVADGTPGSRSVPVVRLDTHFKSGRLDLLKVDVEGFEEDVLRGGEEVLSDAARAPRVIYVEVHPYNWHLCGTTSESLIGRLERYGYTVEHPDGRPVRRIESYGEIVARTNRAQAHATRQA